MVKCNKERIKDFTSDFVVTSDIEIIENCEQNLSNADMLDFRTNMDNLSFYEKTAWNVCDDLIYDMNEKALWTAIVGEIKTPKGVLSNSVGQSNYGCGIWNYIGANLDSLSVSEIENDVINVCNRYPEVNNVIGINSYVADRNMLLIELTLDTIYGTYNGEIHIPTAKISDKNWKSADEIFIG